jgi:hypothetical protein
MTPNKELNKPINAKLIQNKMGITASAANKRLARIKREMNLSTVAILTFCEYYRTDPRVFV